MNYLDFIIAVPLLWGAWKGFQRGLVFEICMIIGMLLGFYLAFKFSSIFEGLVSKYIHDSGNMLPYITFFIVFIAVVLIMVFLAKFLEGLLKIGSLTTVNKILGALFGLLKFGIAVSVILSLLRPVDARVGLLSAETKSHSKLYLPVMKTAHYIFPALQDVKEEFSKRVFNAAGAK